MVSKIIGSALRDSGNSKPMPDWDLDVNRIFEMIVGQAQVTPPPLDGIEVIDLGLLDPEELRGMLILDSLRHFECFKKMGASEVSVLEEAIQKNLIRIVAPLLARVSPHELGRAFTLACANRRLDMVQLMIADGRISSEHFGQGFKIACDMGYPELAAELKNNSRLSRSFIEISDSSFLIKKSTLLLWKLLQTKPLLLGLVKFSLKHPKTSAWMLRNGS